MLLILLIDDYLQVTSQRSVLALVKLHHRHRTQVAHRREIVLVSAPQDRPIELQLRCAAGVGIVAVEVGAHGVLLLDRGYYPAVEVQPLLLEFGCCGPFWRGRWTLLLQC